MVSTLVHAAADAVVDAVPQGRCELGAALRPAPVDATLRDLNIFGPDVYVSLCDGISPETAIL